MWRPGENIINRRHIGNVAKKRKWRNNAQKSYAVCRLGRRIEKASSYQSSAFSIVESIRAIKSITTYVARKYENKGVIGGSLRIWRQRGEI